MVVIGIDLGTTHGCVGVHYNGKVHIIANDQGFRTTPAYVCFENDEIIVGDTALSMLQTHAGNIIYHLKRILRSQCDDVTQCDFVKEWYFDIEKNNETSEFIAIYQQNDKKVRISTTDFIGILLKNLKALAEDFTGEKAEYVVLTVPAHDMERQQNMLAKAAEKADIPVLSFLPEPIAAAIAYNFDEWTASDATNIEQDQAKYVLVFDMGGATHDVTLLSVDKGLFEIVSSTGNDVLGGENFTKLLYQHCAKSFARKTKLDVDANRKASGRLRAACEVAKRYLSTQSQTTIDVDSLMQDQSFSMKISRTRFDELTEGLVRSAIDEVEKVLADAEIEKEDINHVVLVGGSCRIPAIQESIKKYLKSAKLHSSMPPDEVIAFGATLEAAALQDAKNHGVTSETVDQRVDVNVVPLTLSVGLAHGSVQSLIYRGTILPAKATETFTTFEDDQTELMLNIYEGERAIAEKNTLLAQAIISGITPCPKGEAKIKITFAISYKGVLSVVAAQNDTTLKEVELRYDEKRITAKEELEEIVREANDAVEEDDDFLDSIVHKLQQFEVDGDIATQIDVNENAPPAAELD